MSESDPIVFASIAARYSDEELLRELTLVDRRVPLSTWQQALMDEANLRHLGRATASPARVSRSRGAL